MINTSCTAMSNHTEKKRWDCLKLQRKISIDKVVDAIFIVIVASESSFYTDVAIVFTTRAVHRVGFIFTLYVQPKKKGVISSDYTGSAEMSIVIVTSYLLP